MRTPVNKKNPVAREGTGFLKRALSDVKKKIFSALRSKTYAMTAGIFCLIKSYYAENLSKII
jgi:hypothetical protein